MVIISQGVSQGVIFFKSLAEFITDVLFRLLKCFDHFLDDERLFYRLRHYLEKHIFQALFIDIW